MKPSSYYCPGIFAFILLSVMIVSRPAFSKPIIIDNSFEKIPVGLSAEYLEDSKGTLERDDLDKKEYRDKWVLHEKEVLQPGFTRSIFWVRFTVKNKLKESIKLYLEQVYPLIEKISLFLPHRYGRKTIITGNSIPFSERQIEYRTFVIPLELKSGASTTYYMRYQSTSLMSINLILWKISAFEKKRYTEAIFLWMFYGIMLIMALNGLFHFLLLKEFSYLYYSLSLVLFTLTTMSLEGFAVQFLWTNSIWWANICLPVFLGILNYFLVQFGTEFTRVRLKFNEKNERIVLIILNVMKFTGLLLAFLTIILDAPLFGNVSITILIGINSFLGFILLTFSIIQFRTRGSILLMISWLPLLIVVFIYVFKSFSLIPELFLTSYSLHIGAMFSISLISFSLADKIYIMKIEWDELNTKLEEKVEERTAELNSTKEELEMMNDSLFMLNDQIEKAHQLASMDMRMAGNVQSALFPAEVPQTSEWDISFHFKPLSSVSGDLYDFYSEGDTLKGISLLDVSGHGVASGLVTMIARTIFERHFYKGESLELCKVLENVNTDLVKEIGTVDHYLTGIMLRFNNNHVEYVNAAHTNLLFKHADSGNVEVMDFPDDTIRGWFLGFAELEKSYELLEFDVSKDDVILIYTDGLVEGPNSEDIPYGYNRLISSLENAPSGSSREILDFIVNDFYLFTKDESPKDDLTIILLKRS